MSKLKLNITDAVEVIKLIIALLPLVKEILDVLNSWSQDNSVVN